MGRLVSIDSVHCPCAPQVTVPLLEEQYKVKAGSPLSLPCVPPQPGGEVAVEWRHGDTETDSQDIAVDTDTGEASCYCAKLHLKNMVKTKTGENVSLLGKTSRFE